MAEVVQQQDGYDLACYGCGAAVRPQHRTPVDARRHVSLVEVQRAFEMLDGGIESSHGRERQPEVVLRFHRSRAS